MQHKVLIFAVNTRLFFIEFYSFVFAQNIGCRNTYNIIHIINKFIKADYSFSNHFEHVIKTLMQVFMASSVKRRPPFHRLQPLVILSIIAPSTTAVTLMERSSVYRDGEEITVMRLFLTQWQTVLTMIVSRIRQIGNCMGVTS